MKFTQHKSPYILLISDTHIADDSSNLAQYFCEFLYHHKHAQAIYILGDLFEYWLGDDVSMQHYPSICSTLSKLTKTTKVYIQPGNRDFLIGKQFCAVTGCKLLPDPFIASCFNKPVLLMHGDLLCSQDKANLRFRKFIRSSFIKRLFLLMPERIRQAIASHLRKLSNQGNQLKSNTIMDTHEPTVIKYMHDTDAELLIHGHTHKPNTHNFKHNNKQLQRMVLGSWHQHAYYIAISAEHEIKQYILPIG